MIPNPPLNPNPPRELLEARPEPKVPSSQSRLTTPASAVRVNSNIGPLGIQYSRFLMRIAKTVSNYDDY